MLHSYPRELDAHVFMRNWEWVKHTEIEGEIKSENKRRKRIRGVNIWRKRVKEYKEELNSTNPYAILLVPEHIVTSN